MTDQPLRSGWTTGACATAAVKAAATRLVTGHFPDPVTIVLPRGETVAFALAQQESGGNWARAAIIKDAGDDPDVTHGAAITATITPLAAGSGIVFTAGPGVGTITKPGLPLPPGEPAINPVPRQMMTHVLRELGLTDAAIEISVPNGERIAQQTWNPRLGIVGGISILGTTGVVVPYSCSAWIHSIQSGVDVARATGLAHVAGCTGNTSENAVKALCNLSDAAIIDMGDFVGGMLKYLRDHPIARVTIAGGFAKLSKLATGAMDLHSKRSQVDKPWLADQLAALGATPAQVAQAQAANTALEILELAQSAGLAIGDVIAQACAVQARHVLRDAPIALDVMVFDRKGGLVGRAGLSPGPGFPPMHR